MPLGSTQGSFTCCLAESQGVRGSNMQLAPIVEHCGRHALTVDLAGGYIKEYGHGDPTTPLNLGTAEELQTAADQELDDNKRICLFRLGVDCQTLAAIFTGPAAERVFGKALASLDANQLQKKLDWLVGVRIVESQNLLY
jgi:hypothetical protein